MRLDLRREARLLAAAFGMLTRLPVPAVVHQADWLARAGKYFPLVGLAIGAVAAAVFAGAASLWPAPVPALLALASGLLMTGGLHEDGLADTADGLGGATREDRLAIMKDPRLGAFGALTLGLTLALKAAALSILPARVAVAALVAEAATSRVWSVAVMAVASYAGDRNLAKVDHGIEGPRGGEVLVALVLGLLPLSALEIGRSLPALVASAGVATLVAARVCRALGGYTGDVLGAVISLSGAAFLLGAAAGRP